MRKFHKHTRSTFAYWFWHWLAYQITAIKLKAWKPKYLLHDAEKPWLLLLWKKDYKRVQKWHREHNRHHITYPDSSKIDWEALAIDWECSKLTKLDHQLNAYEYYLEYGSKHPETKEMMDNNLIPILIRLNLI